MPEIPASVEGDTAAREHWRRLVTELTRSAVLTTAHGPMLALLAHALADTDRARAAVVALPESLVARQVLDRLTHTSYKLLREFGMSPSSQPLVRGTPPAPADAFERFLTMPRGGKRSRPEADGSAPA